MRTIEEIRKDIDKIDASLVSLLEKRLALSEEIAMAKKETGKAVYDPKREEEKLGAVCGQLQEDRYAPALRQIFTGIMDAGKVLQEEIRWR